MAAILIHCIALFGLPPLLLGVINRTKAFFAGRRGPPLLQVYSDIWKLLRKGLVVSFTTTWVFIAAPVVMVCTTALAGVLVPLGAGTAPLSFAGDMVLFAYLFALGRFFTTLAALDTGSSFEGMGAAREATFACLTEPALFLAFLALARISGTFELTGMLHGTHYGANGMTAPLALVAASLFVVLLAENCRIPVDDPNTHLELTMIHEVMVLDHSGPLLGLILYGAAMKLFVIGALFVQVVLLMVPDRWEFGGVAFALLLCGVGVLVGAVESAMARLQMRHVPHLLIGAIMLAGFGVILLVR